MQVKKDYRPPEEDELSEIEHPMEVESDVVDQAMSSVSYEEPSKIIEQASEILLLNQDSAGLKNNSLNISLQATKPSLM